MLNLILNAFDAMSDEPPDERRLCAANSRCIGTSAVEFAVSDRGKGLPAGEEHKIFDAFYTTKEDGIGLGLAISRTIIEAHGGQLIGRPEFGSRDYDVVQFANSTSAEPVNERACRKLADTKVFLVDDDAAALKSLRWLLESAQLQVEDYSSAEELLEDYDPDVPGCLVIDFRMPGMNGLELQAALLERGCRHPIIFVTGYGDVPTCSRAYHQGAFDFIEKPVNHQAMVDLVNRALGEDARRRAAGGQSSEYLPATGTPHPPRTRGHGSACRRENRKTDCRRIEGRFSDRRPPSHEGPRKNASGQRR